MDGILTVNLGGKPRNLKFNNFSHVEVAKALFGNERLTISPQDVVDRLQELGEQNNMLLMKILVYAGCVGHDYEKGFRAETTQEEVGAWIATADENELVNVWSCFWEAMGANVVLDLLQASEGGGSEKKN